MFPAILLITGLPSDPCIATYANAMCVMKEFLTDFSAPRGHFKAVLWVHGLAMSSNHNLYFNDAQM